MNPMRKTLNEIFRQKIDIFQNLLKSGSKNYPSPNSSRIPSIIYENIFTFEFCHIVFAAVYNANIEPKFINFYNRLENKNV